MLRTEWFLSIQGLTSNEGPILVGLAHDLTVAEIDEAFDGDPQRNADPNLEEQAHRPVWPLDMFFNNSAGNGKLLGNGVVKIGWSVPEGTQLKWFARNQEIANALTTGAVFKITAKHFGVWLKD